jgi:hypothetical protein
MRYFNWQKVQKEAFNAKAKTTRKTGAGALSSPQFSIETVHMRAWAELRRLCLQKELEMLQTLAQQYESGERLHDTFYISHS